MILIVKNATLEGPGLIGEILEKHNIEYKIFDLESGDGFPNPENYDAVIVLGGPDSATDNTFKIVQEISQIKHCLNIKKPYLGICLGMQLMVKANGGEIDDCEAEIGWGFDIDLTDAGKQDPLFEGLNETLPVFQLHGETVKLTNETLLATSDVEVQAIKLGNAYGIQGHLELNQEMFELWMKKDPDLIDLDYEKQMAQYHHLKFKYEETGRKLITNWLKISKIV